MGGVTTPVPPVVTAPAMTWLPRLVSGAFGLSGRLSGLTLWMTGPLPLCACAVLMRLEARNRQTAARTAREMLKILFIRVSLDMRSAVRAWRAEPTCPLLKVSCFRYRPPRERGDPGE